MCNVTHRLSPHPLDNAVWLLSNRHQHDCKTHQSEQWHLCAAFNASSALWSRRLRVDVSVLLVSHSILFTLMHFCFVSKTRTGFECCPGCCKPDVSVSSDIEIAPSTPPTTFPLPLPGMLPSSAAAALLLLLHSAPAELLLLTFLLLGAPLALCCNCCLTCGRPTSYLTSPPENLLRSSFPALVGHPAGRLVPSRPSHVPPCARLAP